MCGVVFVEVRSIAERPMRSRAVAGVRGGDCAIDGACARPFGGCRVAEGGTRRASQAWGSIESQVWPAWQHRRGGQRMIHLRREIDGSPSIAVSGN